jgi:hypothetical protein
MVSGGPLLGLAVVLAGEMPGLAVGALEGVMN